MPDKTGVFRVEISQKDRIEIELAEEHETEAFIAKGTRYNGYLIVGEELRPLPIGSTLDSRAGQFSWMPGPAFLGTYELAFIRMRDGEKIFFPVRVEIKPNR